jgi:hypothetical protein
MPLRRFLQFQLEQHLFRFRWLLPVLVMLFTTYVTFSGVLLQQLNHGLPVNVWDGLFTIFGNGNLLFFVLNVVFLYLISDLLPEKELGQLVVLRLGSRRRWWLGKMLALAFLTLCYAGITVGIVAGVAFFALSLSNAWSDAALKLPLEFYIHPDIVRSFPPWWAFIQVWELFILGWMSLGIWEMVIAQWKQNATWGFIGAMFINLGGLIAMRADLSAPLIYLAPHAHFLLNYHAFEESLGGYLPLWFSWCYWFLWIGVGGFVGLKLSANQDFYRGEHEK